MASVAGPQAGKGVPEPEVENMQLDKTANEEETVDLYTRLKTLQRQIEFFDIQVHSFTPSGPVTCTCCQPCKWLKAQNCIGSSPDRS